MKFSIAFLTALLSTGILWGQGFEHFITTDGYRLMDGDQPFRFISWNIPNLNYVEDEMGFTETNPYGLPTTFEMRDAFETVKEMGGQVIRIYTIPVRNENFPAEAPTFVTAPGVFNERAFQTLDTMMMLANEYEIRIIFSLLNNWQWMGGAPNYAAFRGKEFADFWTDRQLIDDFKQTVAFTINRVNTVTGIPYKEDKAILCWETGNELECPDSWTEEIAAYIKALDPNHLLMDGFFAIDRLPVKESSINNPNIDILSSHHYQRSPFDMHEDITRNLEIIQGRKPYVLGEFGFETTSALISVLDRVIANEEICGALSWSIRYRHRNGGFYWHSEPLGVNLYKAYHWPGFESGAAYDERNFLKLYVDRAYAIQGIDQPLVLPTRPPLLLPIEQVYDIRWQGVAGATGYNVERATEPDGPWDLIAFGVSDAAIQTFANFHDASAQVGETYYYRVRTIKPSGISEPSNVVGPVSVDHQALIDNMTNFGGMYDYHNVEPISGEDRTYKEISSRLKGAFGAEIVYRSPGALDSMRVYSFESSAKWPSLRFYGSQDGENWEELNVDFVPYASSEQNYAYDVPKIYTLKGAPWRYVKMRYMGIMQIARVELMYH